MVALVVHLVYLRMELYLSFIMGRDIIELPKILNKSFQENIRTVAALYKSVEPVSYTHLDVYKRQDKGIIMNGI